MWLFAVRRLFAGGVLAKSVPITELFTWFAQKTRFSCFITEAFPFILAVNLVCFMKKSAVKKSTVKKPQ